MVLTRVVAWVLRFRTNASLCPLVSPGTRLVALDSNAMREPSLLIDALPLPPPVACPPVLLTLTRSSCWSCRS